MDTDDSAIKMATEMQCMTLAAKIAAELSGRLHGKLSSSQAQTAIYDPNKFSIPKFAGRLTEEILSIPIDPWIEERKSISYFYASCFSNERWQNPNWEQVIVPEVRDNLIRPEFIFFQMAGQDAFDAYQLYFGEKEVLPSIIPSQSVRSIKNSIQKRPDSNYMILHVGGEGPDVLYKDYNDCLEQKIICMNALEGIISVFRHRFETGEKINTKSITKLSTLDSFGNTINMSYESKGKFYLGTYNHKNNVRLIHGFRRIAY